MSETIYASVFQESRFIKVVTTEGKDISNQVELSISK